MENNLRREEIKTLKGILNKLDNICKELNALNRIIKFDLKENNNDREIESQTSD